MTRRLALLVLLFLCIRPAAWAHRVDEYLQATILTLQSGRLDASMRMIPGIQVAPAVIAAIDTDHDGTFSAQEKQRYALRVLSDLSLTLNGQPLHPQLVSFTVPQPDQLRDGLGEIHITYSALLPGPAPQDTLVLTNRHRIQQSVYLVNAELPADPSIRIQSQQRNSSQAVYQLTYRYTGQAIPRSRLAQLATRLTAVQFRPLFQLGMHHIAEGTDHLLFLLTLLLPAPILIVHGRWGPPASVRHSLLRILGIVTAFTLGHSLTLALSALGVVHIPGRPVEALIAVSIFISALNAIRPIVRGREALLAGSFGLIHGFAFAGTLTRLGFGPWERLAGILSFNLGIEAMQMIVVAAVLPSLLILSRTRAYSAFRIAGAGFACIASSAWLVERLANIQTPADQVVNLLARHALLLAVALFVLSLACRLLLKPPLPGASHPAPPSAAWVAASRHT